MARAARVPAVEPVGVLCLYYIYFTAGGTLAGAVMFDSAI